MTNGLCEIRGFVLALIKDKNGNVLESHETHNLVTNAGDIYNAQRGYVSPTNTFNALHLGTATTAASKADTASNMTQITGSGIAVVAGFPVPNDTTAENTGKGANVVTWKFSYGASPGPWTAIAEGAIGVGTADLAGGAPLLNRWIFTTPFNKPGGAGGTVLTVYVNLAQLGV